MIQYACTWCKRPGNWQELGTVCHTPRTWEDGGGLCPGMIDVVRPETTKEEGN